MEQQTPDNQPKLEYQQIVYKNFLESELPKKWVMVNFNTMEVEDRFKPLHEKISKIDIFNCTKGITLSSKTNGIGKTHLAVSLFKKFVWECVIREMPISAMFKKEYEFYLELHETYKKDFYKTERELIAEYTDKKKLLIFDDLFSTKENEHARQNMLTLLDKRLDYLAYPTVITTNLTLDEINSIDSRIASRLDNEYFFDLSKLEIDYRKKL